MKIKPTLTKGVAKVPVVMQLEALECGAASLAMASEETLETLRVRVCSPGGSTIEGVKVFQNRALSETVDEALGASFKRTKELGKKN